MNRRFRELTTRATALAIAAALPLLFGTAGTASAGTSSAAVADLGVSFTVQNTNGTDIDCAADGGTYQVRGHLIGPASALDDPQAVTLLLHGLSYGQFFGNYTAQPGYNFAQKQASNGSVTVVVDRLGYGASDKPNGADICFGSRADVAHQIVTELRSGDYSTNGSTSPAFPKVVLAGHSVGGLIAQAEAYSFGDIDGLMVLSYSDTDVSPDARKALDAAVAECAAGGGLQNGDSGPGGYVYFGAATPEQFIKAHFDTANADPTVVDTTAGLRSRDPCGDINSYKAAVKANLTNIGSIAVPTLVVTGGKDAIYPVPADKQAGLFTGSSDVSAVTIPDTGHALTLHHSADQLSAQVSTWLSSRGLGGYAVPAGGVESGGGGTSTVDTGLLVLGGALLAAGAGFVVMARRNTRIAYRTQ